MQNLTLKNSMIYNEISSGFYDKQFMRLVSSDIDLITYDLIDKVHDLAF